MMASLTDLLAFYKKIVRYTASVIPYSQQKGKGSHEIHKLLRWKCLIQRRDYPQTKKYFEALCQVGEDWD